MIKVALSVIAALAAVSLGEDVSNVKFSLPAISFHDLAVLDKSSAVSAANSLITVGALQIVDIPNFASARKEALEDLAHCLENDDTPSFQLADGSTRRSTGAGVASNGRMLSACGEASHSLRAAVDLGTQQLLRSLDIAVSMSQPAHATAAMAPSYSFSDIGYHGNHLEHMHVYYGGPSTDASVSAQDMHTDSGLFVAMTVAHYTSPTNSPNQRSNGLYLQLPSGVVAETIALEDSLVILVGDGGARWLHPVLGQPLRAAPHSLKPSLQPEETRAWFGKMVLPPADAQLGSDTMEYHQYRDMELKALRQASEQGLDSVRNYLPTACGRSVDVKDFGVTTPYQDMLTNTLCDIDGETGVMCWTQCYSVSDLPCGTNAECVDTVTGEPVDGTIMCPSSGGMSACELECLTNEVGNATSDGYCYGNGVTMYMDGFKSIAAEDKGSTACINLLFVDWTLDSKSKFAAACIGVFLLGVAVEVLTMLRRTVYEQQEPSHSRNVTLTALHGIQVFFGYMLMLAAMTYNAELLCMVCAGLIVGYALFNTQAPPPATLDPCCASSNMKDQLIPIRQASGHSTY